LTSPRRAPLVRIGDWCARYPYVLPVLILLLGGAFRLYNLNWDNGHQLHPDERFIYEVVSGAAGNPAMAWPHSFSQFLDISKPPAGAPATVSTGSPLDPHSFQYGSLPLYLLALVAGTIATAAQHVPFLSQWSAVNTYGGLPALGRTLSALLDLLSVVLVFFIGRRVYGYWTGVLAMALTSFTVLDIQLSHFYTVDAVLLPLALLTVLASVHIVQSDSRRPYVWGGIAFGAALATKTTALLLLAPLVSAAVLAAWGSAPWHGNRSLTASLKRQYAATASRLNWNLQWILGTIVIGALTFVICEPYAVLDRIQLLSDIQLQSELLVTNDPPFQAPYTLQYAHTAPYLYQLKNLLFWGMGIPLALAAFGGVLFGLYQVARRRVKLDQAVLLLWIIPYFLFVGRFFAKFDRYMLPIMPIMTLMGAAFLVWLVRRFRGAIRIGAGSILVAVTAASFLYSLAYMNIYAHPNTRVAASRWMFSHIPAGTTIAEEGAWDDPLPIDEQGHVGSVYPELQLNLYDGESSTSDLQHKVGDITNVLTHAHYIVMSSQRMVGSIPRVPGRYPIANRYYDLLFANRLNFRLIKHFQQHPQLGPFVVYDYPADESFHVYDHPNVKIFKRIGPIAPKRVAALLYAAVPAAGDVAEGGPLPATLQLDTRLMLTNHQWKQDQRGQTMDQMFPPNGFAMRHPLIIWLLVLELLGLLGLPVTFFVLGNLLDRGFIIAKTIGLLVLGYLVWIAVSLGAATYDRGVIFLALLVLALGSGAMTYWQRAEMWNFLRREWRRVFAAEVVFLAAFAAMVLLRMWYPDLGHQFSPVSSSNAGGGRMGEKQMELAFLNATVRSRVFPPYDPFFAHGYINYYYYGFFLVGTLCKLTGIAPSLGFNLAIATFFALLAGSLFSIGLTLTRRVTTGLLAVLFVGVIGNLNGAWQLIRGLMSIATVQSDLPLIGGVINVISGLRAAILDRQPLPAFDYWESTRIVPPVGGSIAEFPYFTYLFGDLHAHLIAYPMTAAALALAVNLVAPLRSRLQTILGLAVTALLLGSIAVTNPWDYPTYVLVVGLGAAVGVYARHRRLNGQLMWRPLLWVGIPAIGSTILFWPFKAHYQTVFQTGIGMVRSITPAVLKNGNVNPQDVRDVLVTPLHIYLEHFGFLLFVLLSYLILALWLDTGLRSRLLRWRTRAQFAVYYRERWRQVRHAARVAGRMTSAPPSVLDSNVLTALAILLVGLLILQFFLLAFLMLLLGLVVLLLVRLHQRLAPAVLFVLTLLLIPLALSMGTQVFFVKDFLDGSAGFRMNTIFKFYDQAWLLYAVCAACALTYFLDRRSNSEQAGAEDAGRMHHRRQRRARLRLLSSLPMGATGDSTGGTAHLSLAASSTPPVQVYSRPLPSPGREAAGAVPLQRGIDPASERSDRGSRRSAGSLLDGFKRRPVWGSCFVLLLAGSLVYTYAGTVSRETLRTTWLPERSVPLTLDGMAFMKVAYPQDYAGIRWLNAHVAGAQVIAEAGDANYDWKSRVSQFTGLPDIFNGIHEPEQRWGDEIDPTGLCGQTRSPDACLQHTHARADDVNTLYNSPSVSQAWNVIRTYGVRYIFVGFSEQQCSPPPDVQCYSRAGLAKFPRMVGHGLRVAFHAPGITTYRKGRHGRRVAIHAPDITIYQVTRG